MNRTLTIALGVVALHLGALWALQTGLLHRMVDMVLPAEVLVEIMAPAPAPTPPSTATPRQPSPPKPVPPPPTPLKTAVVEAPAPVPLAVADTHPTPPSAIAPAPGPVNTPPAAPPSAARSAPATAAPPIVKVELPSSDADYLNNPKLPYPSMSKRLGEQGKVVVHTLIGADGMAQKAEIKQSSGFDRLDQTALATALRWRYVPGKRAGVAETMWFNVPFSFVLE